MTDKARVAFSAVHTPPGYDDMVMLLRETRERMELSSVEHRISHDAYRARHYLMMVPSIVISSFLSVLSVFYQTTSPEAEKQYKMLSGCLNAFNTILLGLSGLLMYGSVAKLHESSCAQCNALKLESEMLELELRTLIEGMQTDDAEKEKAEFLRKFVTRLDAIHTKHEEIGEMAPVAPWATLRALDMIKRLSQKKHEVDKYRVSLDCDAIKAKMKAKKVVPDMGEEYHETLAVVVPKDKATNNGKVESIVAGAADVLGEIEPESIVPDTLPQVANSTLHHMSSRGKNTDSTSAKENTGRESNAKPSETVDILRSVDIDFAGPKSHVQCQIVSEVGIGGKNPDSTFAKEHTGRESDAKHSDPADIHRSVNIDSARPKHRVQPQVVSEVDGAGASRERNRSTDSDAARHPSVLGAQGQTPADSSCVEE